MKSITFNSSMVDHIRSGRKTQTRRIIKPQPDGEGYWVESSNYVVPLAYAHNPYGRIGDRFYVFRSDAKINEKAKAVSTDLVIELVSCVRYERIQEITFAEVIAEGITKSIRNFAAIWDSIYGDDAFYRNDWVWVLEFKLVKEA